MVSRNGFTRRDMAGLAAGLIGAPSLAFAAPDYKKFAGTKLEANLIKGPRGELLQKYEKEFTALTGIEIGSEVIPEQQQRQKMAIEFASGKPNFDVAHLSYHVQKRLMEKGKWLAPVSGYMKNPALAEPENNEGDYSAAGLTYAKDGQQMLSLPWSVDYFMVYWNKDLFQKKGIAYPTNFDEMMKAAEALTDPANGVYGFVGRGLRNANPVSYTHLTLPTN